MSDQYVFVVKTPTSEIVEIREPGSQQQIRKIQCSMSEALEILDQLREIFV